ncbi:MAG: ABC transporter ATP-binding protein [Atopobiaceae bacterium]|nr:ABC transporter ATP-binding protein [Atopobiaceae bacterium]
MGMHTGSSSAPLLDVRHMSLSFDMYGEGVSRHSLDVISDLDISIEAGMILAVVGSSGSGKSLLAHAVLGILPSNARVSGEILYKGEPLDENRLEALRGREIAFVPQSVSYLDPLMKVGPQVTGLFGSDERRKGLFASYGLDESVARMFPHQLSGGMTRRVLISGAQVGSPELVIADEPTPGLTTELADQVMEHFHALAEAGCAILLITHDLSLAVRHADAIAVFYAGTTVEVTPVADFRAGGDALRHPYTKTLWRAMPENGFDPIPGTQPYAGTVVSGCPFADRCPLRDDACAGDIPTRELRGGEVRCVHAE